MGVMGDDMQNISDLIEQFILDALGTERSLDISRNELANFFDCAPSQINYVLDTRFTLDRGFNKSSKRGGGGFIKLTKIPVNQEDDDVNLILSNIGNELSFRRANQIINNLNSENIVTDSEAKIVLSMLSDEALKTPLNLAEKLRAKIFKQMLLYLINKEGEQHE